MLIYHPVQHCGPLVDGLNTVELRLCRRHVKTDPGAASEF